MSEVCILHVLTELWDLRCRFSFQSAWKVHTASGHFLTWMERHWLISSDSPVWHSAGQQRQMEQGEPVIKQQRWAQQVFLCRQWWWWWCWTGVQSGRRTHTRTRTRQTGIHSTDDLCFSLQFMRSIIYFFSHLNFYTDDTQKAGFPSFRYFVCAAFARRCSTVTEMLRHCLVILIMMTKKVLADRQRRTLGEWRSPKKMFLLFLCAVYWWLVQESCI